MATRALFRRGQTATRSVNAWIRTRALTTQVADASETAAEASKVSELAGKQTRENILNAFSARAMATIKYEYFAQRAEVECELDAAHTFRALMDSSKQQAMGYLELLEDYSEADYAHTVANIENAAIRERELAETTYPSHAEIAAKEELEHVDQWFQDMGDASSRAAERLEVTAAMLDPEAYPEDAEIDIEEHDLDK